MKITLGRYAIYLKCVVYYNYSNLYMYYFIYPCNSKIKKVQYSSYLGVYILIRFLEVYFLEMKVKCKILKLDY